MDSNVRWQNWLTFSGLITALFLLGILGSRGYRQLKNWLQHPPQAIIFNAERDCNPMNEFCTASGAALTVKLRLGDNIKPLAVFPILVDLSGEDAANVKRIAVNFAMSDMNMGFNRFALSQGADKIWRGQALLPVCSRGQRDWRVTVELISDRFHVGEFYLLIGH